MRLIKRIKVYDPEPYTYKYALDPEPWRVRYPAARLVPVKVLRAFADPRIIAKQRSEEYPYILELAESMRTEGVKVPVVMVLDERGKLRYHDGYHRLAACGEAGVMALPVLMKHSEIIRGYGRQVSDNLDLILDHLNGGR